MSTRFIQPGGTLTLKAPKDTKSGDIVIVGHLIGVAEFDAKQGAEIETKLWGVHTFAKDGSAFSQGDLCYVDANGKVATSGTPLGVAVLDAGADAAEVRVLISGTTA